MSDSTEFQNQNTQTPETPSLETLASAMAETELAPPPSATAKYPNVSFSIWPPTERTRDAVRNRLIETLSSSSILSKRYGTLSRDDATEAANRIEEEAFDTAGKSGSADADGIEILQNYSKEISKRTLEIVKARSVEPMATPPPVNEAADKAEDGDSCSTAPPQSEKTESIADDE